MKGTKIKGIKEKTMWAVFAPDGNIQFRTISETRKEAQERALGWWEEELRTWKDYASIGFTTNKVLIDIKLL